MCSRVIVTCRAAALTTLSFLAGQATASGQRAWTLVGPGTGYQIGVAAYDEARARIVLHAAAGWQSATTWEYDGATWKLLWSGSRPGFGGFTPALAYDPLRRVTVLFGAGETWLWDGATWTEAQPAAVPPPRLYAGMVFDSARGRMVLFGGQTPPPYSVLGDTWEWDGSTWTEVSPASGPAARSSPSMCFDAHRARVVMFGGGDGMSATFGLADTWEWDGGAWVQRQLPRSPSPRWGAGLVFDEVRGVSVLYAGRPDSIGEIWEYDGETWLQAAPVNSPGPLELPALVYDRGRKVIVLACGVIHLVSGTAPADTWQYEHKGVGTYTTLGPGCAGTAGMPLLEGVPHYPPTRLDFFEARVHNLGSASLSTMLVGLSKTRWGSLTLPFDLTPIGMPGCTLHASGNLSFPLLNIGGTARWMLLLPDNLGLHFYNQALVWDPAANSAGLILSNAAEAVIGS